MPTSYLVGLVKLLLCHAVDPLLLRPKLGMFRQADWSYIKG